MSKWSISIIGNGFVGGAIARGFGLYADVKVYDIDPKKCIHTIDEVCKSKFVFLCLPTPMMNVTGGGADLSIVHSVCKQVSEISRDPIYIMKSTVPIGTTLNLGKHYDLKLIHNPEFLTARNADIDFLTPARTIFGGDKNLCSIVGEMFAERFPGTNIMYMSSRSSEAVKYVANCFFCVKVMFFNEMYLGLQGVDWNDVMAGVLADGRIGNSHTQVPGHDGGLGFSGSCFPKDISSLIAQLDKFAFDAKMLKACWEQNKIIRPQMDWADILSAVSKKKE